MKSINLPRALSLFALVASLFLLFSASGVDVAKSDGSKGKSKSLKLAGSYKAKKTCGAVRVFIAGKKAYLICNEKGLVLLNISNLKKPREESSLLIPNPDIQGSHYRFQGLCHNKSYIYASDDKENFWVIKVAKKKLVLTGKVKAPETGGVVMRFTDGWIHFGNSRVYIDSDNGVKIFDVKSAKKPRLIKEIKIEKLSSFKLSGRWLIAVTDKGLSVYNVSSASGAKEITFLERKPNGYCIQKNLLYLVRFVRDRKNLIIYNLSKITAKKSKGECKLEAGSVYGPYVSGDYAYIYFWKREKDERKLYLQCIDVSDPAKPEPKGKIEVESEFDSILARDSFVIAGTKDKKLYVIDFTDKENPKTIYSVSLPYSDKEKMTLDIDGKYIYTWNNNDQIRVYMIPSEMKKKKKK
ncbi:MAG: hypothetical protein E3J72_03790 [Planctomycetota bacterium]|nr:MAG: hypothetical protein E3J72_03790 [Planctomycetota bacterium]